MNKCICRICGSEKTTQIYDQVSQAPESSVYLCQACGINFIHPIMSQQEEDDFYAESFENYMAQRSGPSWESPEEHFFSQQSFVKDKVTHSLEKKLKQWPVSF